MLIDLTGTTSRDRLDEAIQALYDDAPIIGDPERLDFAETVSRRR